jgi:tyrosyl-tRNA synthetase
MFGKIMSISDELMWRYYELLSFKTTEEIEELKAIHPKKAKEILALEIVERFHSKEAALEAKEHFELVHKRKEVPDEVPEFEKSSMWLPKLLVEIGLEKSTSQARRDIKAGAVKINGNKILDEQMHVTNGEYMIQVGKRKFAKVKVV